jgi:type II secretory pathway component PulF
MAVENEFLPFLNSWPLFLGVVTVMLGLCFLQYVVPHIKEQQEAAKTREKQA